MKCPGQDSRYWGQEAIFEVKCPECGNEMEFFQDDTWRRCSKCGHRLQNPRMNFGCAEYCPYARQCVGNLPAEVLNKEQEAPLKDRLAVAVKKILRGDFTRIAQAVRTAHYVEEAATEDSEYPVLVLSAHLMPLAVKLIREKKRPMDEAIQNVEKILESVSADKDLTEKVKRLLLQTYSGDDRQDQNVSILRKAFQEASAHGKPSADVLPGYTLPAKAYSTKA